jgi:hypothetical protein
MELAFVNDNVAVLALFCDSPLYFACYPGNGSGDEFGSDCILSHAVWSLWDM